MKKFYIQGYGEFLVKPSECQTISSATPQTSFVLSHFADIRKECGAIKAILGEISSDVRSVADGMAGSGFSGAIFRSVYGSKLRLVLNDLSADCVDNLKLNFPKCKITQEDINTWNPGKVDLIFLDFNNLTLKRIEDWRGVIERLAQQCKNLLITDSACYGFRMGNLKGYKVKTAQEYYCKLSEELKLNRYQKCLSRYCIFGNAALVLFEEGQRFLSEVKPVTVNITSRKGFGL